MASSSSSSIGHRRPRLADEQEQTPPAQVPRREGKTEEEEEEEEARDWAALPVDALLVVFGRLDGVDILMGAGHVCQPWRRATREEPDLWRRVHMRRRAGIAYDVNIQAAARAAVRRSAGRCEAFLAEDYAGAPMGYDDDFFLFLADAAPMLKSLRLVSCNKVFPHMINQTIRKFPLLEELELSLYHRGSIDDCLIGISEACPLLTRLRLNHDRFYYLRLPFLGGFCKCKSTEVARMRRLRSLQLFGNSIRNEELPAILNGCRQLETLDIRHCLNVRMNDEMRARFVRMKTVRLPEDSMEDYELRYGSPINDFIYYSGVMYPD
ncbi:unnamed protein product [Urochloa decumbens]|uniref:F-box domain-containing protein n=1 Tax=Urochloa decumbens TaxID=240449 RepID=A0ABC9BTD8_9POAL